MCLYFLHTKEKEPARLYTATCCFIMIGSLLKFCKAFVEIFYVCHPVALDHNNAGFIPIKCNYCMLFIHSLVISLEGRAWQEPEPSRVTGMALAHCILGKFLGGSLPLLSPGFRRSHFSRQVPPSATTREILAAKGGTVGEKDIR